MEELVRTRYSLQLQLSDEPLFVKYHKLAFKNFWGRNVLARKHMAQEDLENDRIVRMWTD